KQPPLLLLFLYLLGVKSVPLSLTSLSFCVLALFIVEFFQESHLSAPKNYVKLTGVAAKPLPPCAASPSTLRPASL
ncbi:MAG: hypothetical protein AB1801_15455, partial [Chloroflexota bacterium]